MGKKVEVSYNPQLGYLQTIFHHNFDFLTGIKSYTERTDGVEFVVDTYKENTVKVFIQCVGETAFRFRMYTPGNEHPFDNSIYQLEGQNGVNITENEEFISISKGKIEARVRKYPWEVSYYLDGKLKTKEQIKDSNVDNMCKNLPVGFTYDENKEIIGVNETMYLYADEEFYGFGEKFTDFGKRGQTINCWQTDALSTNTEKSYKNHPFFMSSRGYAILLNTYTRSKFEMGSFSNVAYNMSVEDKVLDYVIWMGNDYKALLKSYINQTGKIPMIPKWALGLWMSKCSYQTQDEIYEVVKISKERDIKIDVIHIDGWQKEGDAGAWVWDYERFPNPEEMIYKLKKEGIHLCLWIFPYIDENSKYFKEAEEKGFLVKNTKGVTSRFYSTATSTSKVGCFDFTNPHFIEWYKPKVRSVVSMGIGAVKTDFSEAVPEDAVYFDGSTGIQGHNKLTFLYAKTIYDIMAEVKIPLGELPMLWGRSGYAGSHTIPAAWAGDSSTHLNNHACILRGGLSASMSGIPFWGFDMGGFYNTDHEGYECVPTDEEYIRSCQFGFFNSLSRCHGKTPREPWNFGEKAEKIFKKFNDIRHLLLPYLYSTTYKTHLSDIPVIRPVVMEYPEDRSARNVELEYFLGDSLLVVPVFDQEDEIDVYLPNGQWIDLFTHERIKGGRWVKRKIELDKIPVFIRQNKMIPMLTKIPENIEEKYENLDVILFCEDEIRDTYIDEKIGILLMIGPCVVLLTQRFWAKISDRTGKRKEVLLVTIVGSGFSMLLYYLGNSFLCMFFATVVVTSFTTAVIPLSDAILIARSLKEGYSYSIIRLGGTLGYAVMTICAGMYLKTRPQMQFVFAFFAYMILFCFCIGLKEERNGQIVINEVVQENEQNRIFKNRDVYIVLGLAFVSQMGLSFYTGLLDRIF